MPYGPEALFDWITGFANDPLLLGLALMVATFVTEDGALVTASLLVGAGILGASAAITWLVGGILVGDIALYGFGALAGSSDFVRRNLAPKKLAAIKVWLKGRETSVLFLSRFLPGTRLATYLAFGYLGLSLARFTAVMFVAGLIWVSAMIFFISEIQQLLENVGKPVALSAAALIAFTVLYLIPKFVRRYSKAPTLEETS